MRPKTEKPAGGADSDTRAALAVRSASEAIVVAPGTSCRQQIADGTGRRALHPAEYLAARLRVRVLG